MSLVAADGDGNILQVVGVGRRVGNRIQSIGKTHFTRFEAIGFSVSYSLAQTEAMENYAAGNLGINELMVRLQNDF